MPRNPAIARRYTARGSVPAHLDDAHAHLTAAGTRNAQRAVAEVLAGRGTPLGQGNFGASFAVSLDGEPLVVKFGSRRTIHTRSASDMYAWTTKKWSQGGRSLAVAAEEMTHEAGVANELEARGHKIVPSTVYAPFKGRPALVREFGAIPANVTRSEYDALSLALGAVIADGFTVRDDLLVARRRDGSLFIADVGFWSPYRHHSSDTYFTGGEADARVGLSWELSKFSRSLPWSGGEPVPSAWHVREAHRRLEAVEATHLRHVRDPDEPFLRYELRREVAAIAKLTTRRREAGMPA